MQITANIREHATATAKFEAARYRSGDVLLIEHRFCKWLELHAFDSLIYGDRRHIAGGIDTNVSFIGAIEKLGGYWVHAQLTVCAVDAERHVLECHSGQEGAVEIQSAFSF